MYFVAAVAAAVFFAAAVLLLLHHGYEHWQEDAATSVARRESCLAVCYFQLSDVGNVKTWNHENFIVLFAAAGRYVWCGRAFIRSLIKFASMFCISCLQVV